MPRTWRSVQVGAVTKAFLVCMMSPRETAAHDGVATYATRHPELYEHVFACLASWSFVLPSFSFDIFTITWDWWDLVLDWRMAMPSDLL